MVPAKISDKGTSADINVALPPPPRIMAKAILDVLYYT
jgi:hypothetical protein